MIKSYLIKSSHKDEKENQKILINNKSKHKNQSESDNQNVSSENQNDNLVLTRSIRKKRLSRKYQNIIDITVFLQDEDKTCYALISSTNTSYLVTDTITVALN